MARDIRQLALERIAALSAATSTTTFYDRSDLDRLCRACLVVGKREAPNGGDQHATKQPGRVPMVRDSPVLGSRVDNRSRGNVSIV
jgi:phosphatidylinositol 4-kinase